MIRFSEAFPDPKALLAECARLGLEGIVAKRKFALSIRHAQRLDKGQNAGEEGCEQIPRQALHQNVAAESTGMLILGRLSTIAPTSVKSDAPLYLTTSSFTVWSSADA